MGDVKSCARSGSVILGFDFPTRIGSDRPQSGRSRTERACRNLAIVAEDTENQSLILSTPSALFAPLRFSLLGAVDVYLSEADCEVFFVLTRRGEEE